MPSKIIVAIFLAVLVGTVFYFLTTRWIAEHRPKPEEPTLTAAEETGPNTYCTATADCWCRNYSTLSARFLPGRTPSACNTSASRCRQCIYE